MRYRFADRAVVAIEAADRLFFARLDDHGAGLLGLVRRLDEPTTGRPAGLASTA